MDFNKVIRWTALGVLAFVVFGLLVPFFLVAYFAPGQFESNFWSNYISTLIATGLAVVVGVPVGLWLNRQAIVAAEHKEEAQQQRLLDEALTTLLTALQHNHEELKGSNSILEKNGLILLSDFDTSAWDAVKDRVVGSLGDPELQRELASHFAHSAELAQAYMIFLQHILHVRVIPQYGEDAAKRTNELNANLRTSLIRGTNKLLTDTVQLIKRLEETIAARASR